MVRRTPGWSASRRWSAVRSGSQTPRPVGALAWGSRSITRTRLPAWAAADANPSATVVFPTPPFWFTRAIADIAATLVGTTGAPVLLRRRRRRDRHDPRVRREAHGEPRPADRGVPDLDGGAVVGGDAAGDRQTEPGAPLRAAARLVQAGKPLEHLLAGRHRHPRAVVVDLEHHARPVGCEPHGRHRGPVPPGVLDQVPHEARELALVPRHAAGDDTGDVDVGPPVRLQ